MKKINDTEVSIKPSSLDVENFDNNILEEESDDGENNEADSQSDEDENEDGNAGWANSIAKVLNSSKPKTKKSVVLSRAKKLQPGKELRKKDKPTYDFEVEGEIKEAKTVEDDTKPTAKQRKNIQLPLRVRPTWKDLERERTLRKVATKGVVQLFNAVRIQQKDIENQLEKAGPLDSRKDAVLNNINKKKFLDVLMSGSRAKSEPVDNSVKLEKGEDFSNEESDGEEDEGDDAASDSGRKRKSQWSALRPDFMTNKKIKHWDEEDENSDDGQTGSMEGSDENDEE